MRAVVLNVKANGGQRETEHNGARDDEKPIGQRQKDEKIGAKEPDEDRRGFEIHARRIALRPAGAVKVSVDLGPQYMQEAIRLAELEGGLLDI